MAWYYWILIGYVANVVCFQFMKSKSGSTGEAAMADGLLVIFSVVPFSLPFVAVIGGVRWIYCKITGQEF